MGLERQEWGGGGSSNHICWNSLGILFSHCLMGEVSMSVWYAWFLFGLHWLTSELAKLHFLASVIAEYSKTSVSSSAFLKCGFLRASKHFPNITSWLFNALPFVMKVPVSVLYCLLPQIFHSLIWHLSWLLFSGQYTVLQYSCWKYSILRSEPCIAIIQCT